MIDFTISSFYVNPTFNDLAEFEMSAMRSVRDLVQRHLDTMPLTAALDPGELVSDDMVAEFESLAEALWYRLDFMSDGFGLELLPLATFQPLVRDAIKTAGWRFTDVLRSLVGKVMDQPLQGEFRLAPDYVPGTGTRPPAPYTVQFGDIRTILNELGGGGSDSAVPLSSGITSGLVFRDVLDANGIPSNEMLWLYGQNARREFNGHVQMDGLVFSSWEDPALEISPQDYWLRRSHYAVGDHWGCACVVVPYVPNFGDAVALTVDPEEFGFNPNQPRDKEGQWVGGWAAHRDTITSLDRDTIESVAGKGIERMFFNGGSGIRPTPWPRAPRSKTSRPYDPDLVREALRKPPVLEKVDSRILYSTQPSILKEHVVYYLTDEYQRTGRTSADQDNAGNAYPTIYVNKRGHHLILSGHHRAAAALAKGEPLEARIIRE